jgi:hypothetical protein
MINRAHIEYIVFGFPVSVRYHAEYLLGVGARSRLSAGAGAEIRWRFSRDIQGILAAAEGGEL